MTKQQLTDGLKFIQQTAKSIDTPCNNSKYYFSRVYDEATEQLCWTRYLDGIDYTFDDAFYDFKRVLCDLKVGILGLKLYKNDFPSKMYELYTKVRSELKLDNSIPGPHKFDR